MPRFITLGNTEFNIDQIVCFARPTGKPTMLTLAIVGSPMITISDTPDQIMTAIRLCGAGGDFIELASTTLMVGKIWFNVNHITCIQEVAQGSSILLSKSGAQPETVREKPNVIRELIRGPATVQLN